MGEDQLHLPTSNLMHFSCKIAADAIQPHPPNICWLAARKPNPRNCAPSIMHPPPSSQTTGGRRSGSDSGSGSLHDLKHLRETGRCHAAQRSRGGKTFPGALQPLKLCFTCAARKWCAAGSSRHPCSTAGSVAMRCLHSESDTFLWKALISVDFACNQ